MQRCAPLCVIRIHIHAVQCEEAGHICSSRYRARRWAPKMGIPHCVPLVDWINGHGTKLSVRFWPYEGTLGIDASQRLSETECRLRSSFKGEGKGRTSCVYAHAHTHVPVRPQSCMTISCRIVQKHTHSHIHALTDLHGHAPLHSAKAVCRACHKSPCRRHPQPSRWPGQGPAIASMAWLVC